MIGRRDFLKGAVGASSAVLASGCQVRQQAPPKWDAAAFHKSAESRVAVLAAGSYQAPLDEILFRGLKLFSLDLKGKSIVLKPNLVEYDPNAVINTNPTVVRAAVEAFRRSGAAEVVIAEGPGHRRDNEYLLTASGLLSQMKDLKVRYVDLNSDDPVKVPLRSSFTRFGHLYFPATILKADLLVSMPKLKTHHWAGATLSMKNMFGLVPGSIYGWPKNALHWAGIHESIVDINSSLAVRRFAIVDGIVGMEGNGPIQGDARHCGALILGEDSVAVDATCARLMKLNPERIDYIRMAGEFLGNIAEEKIRQLAERVDRFQQDFRVLDSFQHLKSLGQGRTEGA